jgi:hypothetical protein
MQAFYDVSTTRNFNHFPVSIEHTFLNGIENSQIHLLMLSEYASDGFILIGICSTRPVTFPIQGYTQLRCTGIEHLAQ